MEVENSIYVGGLAYDSKEEVVKKAFVEYGDVVSVKIMYDRGSGGSRGFGFVTFKNSRAAMNAIREMNGNQIAGRTVRVNEVRKNRLLGFRDRENGDKRWKTKWTRWKRPKKSSWTIFLFATVFSRS